MACSSAGILGVKRRYRYALVGALAAALSSFPARAGWRMVFEDRFDGTGLDRSRWATRYIYDDERLDHLNDEVQRYRDADNHRVKGGTLSLIARADPAGGYQSGMIRSRRTFLYGYFEARVRLPRGRGIWPAFWLNPDRARDGSLEWPPEIDIFEYAVNGVEDTESMLHSGVHEAVVQPATWHFVDPAFERASGTFRSEGRLNAGWHVFGLLWQPDRIVVTIDGRRLYDRSFRWLNRKGAVAAPAHVLLNFAVGGKWAGRHGIDRAAFPQALEIDYVRVCQQDAGAIAQSCGGTTPPATHSPSQGPP